MGLAEVKWNRRASHLNTEMAETSLIGFRQKLSTTTLRLQNIDFTLLVPKTAMLQGPARVGF